MINFFVVKGVEELFKGGCRVADLMKLLFYGNARRGLGIEFVGVDG